MKTVLAGNFCNLFLGLAPRNLEQARVDLGHPDQLGSFVHVLNLLNQMFHCSFGLFQNLVLFVLTSAILATGEEATDPMVAANTLWRDDEACSDDGFDTVVTAVVGVFGVMVRVFLLEFVGDAFVPASFAVAGVEEEGLGGRGKEVALVL